MLRPRQRRHIKTAVARSVARVCLPLLLGLGRGWTQGRSQEYQTASALAAAAQGSGFGSDVCLTKFVRACEQKTLRAARPVSLQRRPVIVKTLYANIWSMQVT